jgi:hypothetical protein
MNRKAKASLIKDLLSGKKIEDISQPDGVVIVLPGGYECLNKKSTSELDNKPLFRINTYLGEQVVSWNQLQKVWGKEKTLIFLPENNLEIKEQRQQ